MHCRTSCGRHQPSTDAPSAPARRARITVLLDDSLSLIRGKRIGLITNQTGVDAAGVSDIELLRGTRAQSAGVVLSTGLVESGRASRSALPYALYPFPLRHGMTMGDAFNGVLGINAPLHVVPVAGWRRAMWFDQTGLPWVRPSPNLPTLASALVYPSLVAFAGSNLSVGRGTTDAFQRFGAPWLNTGRVSAAVLWAVRLLRNARRFRIYP